MKPRTCTFDIKFHFTLHSFQSLDSVCTKSVISFSKDDKYSLVLGTWRTQPRFNTALTCKYRQILYCLPNKIAGNIISTHKSFISRKFALWATGEQVLYSDSLLFQVQTKCCIDCIKKYSKTHRSSFQKWRGRFYS